LAVLAIDAKNKRVAGWYASYGAMSLLDAPLSLVLPLATIEAVLKEAARHRERIGREVKTHASPSQQQLAWFRFDRGKRATLFVMLHSYTSHAGRESVRCAELSRGERNSATGFQKTSISSQRTFLTRTPSSSQANSARFCAVRSDSGY